MNKLPISVIIPLQEHRRDFFENKCLPTIEKQNPSEIIIIDNDGRAPYKRNLGLKKSKPYEYILFSDDDITYPDGWAESMINSIKDNDILAFSYTGYYLKGHGKLKSNKNFNRTYNAPHFNLNKLKTRNFISTMSMLKSKYLVEWDENDIMYRFQDWEYFLRICLKYNVKGKLNQNHFTAHYFEDVLNRKYPNNIKKTIFKYIKNKLLIEKKY
jgi:hypothetical protein